MIENLRPVNMGGVIVLSVFAAIWAAGGLAFAGVPALVWAVPAIISAGLIIAGARLSRHNPPVPQEEQRRTGRLIGLWSSVEGIAIFVAIRVLIAGHREQLIAGAICTIVGLHFFPLGCGIPLRLYYFSGLAMTLLGVGALVAGSVIVPAIVGIGAALILWATLVAILWPARVSG